MLNPGQPVFLLHLKHFTSWFGPLWVRIRQHNNTVTTKLQNTSVNESGGTQQDSDNKKLQNNNKKTSNPQQCSCGDAQTVFVGPRARERVCVCLEVNSKREEEEDPSVKSSASISIKSTGHLLSPNASFLNILFPKDQQCFVSTCKQSDHF